MTTKQDYEAALERWIRYEQEYSLCNSRPAIIEIPVEAPPDIPTVVVRRELLLRWRADYALLRNVVAELLELDPENMTPLQVFGAMAKRSLDGLTSLEE